jgi:hypothetical protein
LSFIAFTIDVINKTVDSGELMVLFNHFIPFDGSHIKRHRRRVVVIRARARCQLCLPLGKPGRSKGTCNKVKAQRIRSNDCETRRYYGDRKENCKCRV